MRLYREKRRRGDVYASDGVRLAAGEVVDVRVDGGIVRGGGWCGGVGDRFGDGEREVCARCAWTGGLVVVAFTGKEKGRLIASVRFGGSFDRRGGCVPGKEMKCV